MKLPRATLGKMLKTFLLAFTSFNLARCEPVQMRAQALLTHQMVVNTDLTKTRRAEFVKAVAGSSFTLNDFNLFFVNTTDDHKSTTSSTTTDDNDDDDSSSSSCSAAEDLPNEEELT